MKKFVPVILGLALTIGAVTMFAGPQPEKSTMKSTKKGKKATK